MSQIAELTREKIIDRFRERINLGRRTKLYKAEFEALTADFIAQLATATTPADIQRLCNAEIALLEEGYPQLTLASDYIPKYRKAIERAIATQTLTLTPATTNSYAHQQRVTGTTTERAEHLALTYFKYDSEVYDQLDQRQAQVNRTKLLNLKGVNPHHYLKVLNDLLYSTERFQARHRAIAISGLTGRRLGEVLARGTFTLANHPHLLYFEGQQKHDRSGYNIITLIPAQELLEQIQRFRKLPDIQDLMVLQREDLTQAINKFDVQVNRECNKFLRAEQAVVPPLANRVNVTIHNLRSLWGAIAVWMFCPPQQHEYAFIQHYLGHVLESSATGHYFRYQLIDDNGQLLRDKGAYLNQVPELPLFDTNTPDAPSVEDLEDIALSDLPATLEQPNGDDHLVSTLRTEFWQHIQQVKAELRAEWTAQMATLRRDVALPPPQSPPHNIEWLVNRVSDLEAENQTLQQKQHTLRQDHQALLQAKQQLEHTNQDLSTQLRDAQTKLDQLTALLLGEEAPQPPPEESPKDQLQPSSSSPQSQSTRSSPMPSAQTSSPVSKGKHGRKPGKAQARAQRIFTALQAWNQQHPDDTITLNPGLLETGFRIHRQAAKQFCIDFAAEIEAHNQQIGVVLASTHNRGKDIQGFIAFATESFQNHDVSAGR